MIGDSKKSLPEAFYSLNDILDQASDQRPDRKCRAGITLNSTLCYIYTSGTTGNYFMEDQNIEIVATAMTCFWRLRNFSSYSTSID